MNKKQLCDTLFVPVDPNTPAGLLTEVPIYTIEKKERKDMEARLANMPCPYGSGFDRAWQFIRQNKVLSPALNEFAYQMGNNVNCPAFFALTECPRDAFLGEPSPVGLPPIGKSTFISEGFSLSLLDAMQLHPAAMKNEWHQETVQNLVQIKSKSKEQSSASAQTDLGSHVDDLSSGDKRICKTMTRIIQAPSVRPYTTLSDAQKAVQYLLEYGEYEVLEILQNNKLHAVPPVSQRGGKAIDELRYSEAMPILVGPLPQPQINLEFLGDTLIFASDNVNAKQEVEWAIERYKNASNAVAVKAKLPAHSLACFDNRRGQHGRLKWQASYRLDQLRWGIRINAVADPFRSRSYDGHIFEQFRGM